MKRKSAIYPHVENVALAGAAAGAAPAESASGTQLGAGICAATASRTASASAMGKTAHAAVAEGAARVASAVSARKGKVGQSAGRQDIPGRQQAEAATACSAARVTPEDSTREGKASRSSGSQESPEQQQAETASRPFSSPVLALIWFGASVSLAEILTGTFFAPLGIARGTAAILLGHLIGGAMFFLVALASARTGASAMETAGRAFGRIGQAAFGSANTVQLLGWTAIMVASGAAAAAVLVPQIGFAGWCLAIGALIVVWIAIGSQRMSRVQSVAAVALFALTVVACVGVLGRGGGAPAGTEDALAFGAAVELAAAMPLSWLPVAGDYTRGAKSPLAGSAASTLAYTAGSCWMFFIGLGLALFAGTGDFAEALAASGLGLVGILVVVFSTVTTTFLDAQSAGLSANAVSAKAPAKTAGIVAAVVGTALAIFAPVGNFEGFLYLIGSVFAPMAAVVCVDALVFGNDSSHTSVNWTNAVLWLAGFALYRISLGWNLPCGNTLPVIAVIALATFIVHKARRR